MEQTQLAGIRVASLLLAPISRTRYFASLFMLACANGLLSRATESVYSAGWASAFLSTFEISAIVWFACVAGVMLVLEQGGVEPVRRGDLLLGLPLLILIVLPIGGLSWLAVASLSLYVIATEHAGSTLRRGTTILLAVTVPMLWSRLLFRYFADYILQIDASLVSRLLGTARDGNLVRFVDGSGALAILPYCSSLQNVSLALLAWVAINQWVGHRASLRDLQWCGLACLSVVSVNVTRMSLMGFSQAHYTAIHSTWGNAIANWLTLSLIVAFCLIGVRRGMVSRV